MVKIRLRRVGSKKQPSFRIVVADERSPRDGRFIEEIGFYNPRTEPETLRIDEAKALHWLSVGAQPTDSVARLLRTLGTWERFERLRGGEAMEELVAEAVASKKEELDEAPEPELSEEGAPEEELTEEETEEPEGTEPAEIEEAEIEEAEVKAPEDESPEVEEETEESESDILEGESDSEEAEVEPEGDEPEEEVESAE